MSSRRSLASEPSLVASVRRRPTPLTVWMINRVLNAERRAAARAGWLALLEAIAADDAADDVARQQAREYLEHQASR